MSYQLENTEPVRIDFLVPYSGEEYVFTCDYCGKEKIKRHGSKTTYGPGSTRKYGCCQGRHTKHTVTSIVLKRFKTEDHYMAWRIARELKRRLEEIC